MSVSEKYFIESIERRGSDISIDNSKGSYDKRIERFFF
jgi:hypothetical protein